MTVLHPVTSNESTWTGAPFSLYPFDQGCIEHFKSPWTGHAIGVTLRQNQPRVHILVPFLLEYISFLATKQKERKANASECHQGAAKALKIPPIVQCLLKDNWLESYSVLAVKQKSLHHYILWLVGEILLLKEHTWIVYIPPCAWILTNVLFNYPGALWSIVLSWVLWMKCKFSTFSTTWSQGSSICHLCSNWFP